MRPTVPSTEQLIEMCRQLGYQVCTDHIPADITDAEARLRLMSTVYAMSVTHLAAMGSIVPNGAEKIDTTFHNVGAQTGLVPCDDPHHLIACCGPIEVTS